LQPGQIVPAIPTGFIVVKDVLIKANWSDADAAHASSAASFGPFINIESHFDTGSGTYVIKGMQILAWLCEVPPFLPPGNDISIPTPPASVPS
jgi:2-oxoglutarate dehydrogenase E2 component (dihydrolipoamide succinyltransferase)